MVALLAVLTGGEGHQAENPGFEFHEVPFQDVVTPQVDIIISRSRSQYEE